MSPNSTTASDSTSGTASTLRVPTATKRIAAIECGGTSFKVAVVDVVAAAAGDFAAAAPTADSADSSASAHAPPPSVVIRHRCLIRTAAGPAATLAAVRDFLDRHGPYEAAGVACFGPVHVKKAAAPVFAGGPAVDDEDGGGGGGNSNYGRIYDTCPKREWRGVRVGDEIRRAVGKHCPLLIDTDVNAPAAAEFHRAVQQQMEQQQQQQQRESSPSPRPPPRSLITSCAYVTVGTGVGVGLVVNGQTVHGLMHPEAGHVPVVPLPNDTFGGYSWGRVEHGGGRCPFGGVNTVETLASSVALAERYCQSLPPTAGGDGSGVSGGSTGVASSSLPPQLVDRDVLVNVPDGDEIWDHAANALGGLCATLLLTLSVERIVLGGGILRRGALLLPKIRAAAAQHLNGYLDLSGDSGGGGTGNVAADLERIIVTSQHGDDAGLQGAIFLARRALAEASSSTSSKKTDAAANDANDVKRTKQVAFHTGLWSGVLVGGIGTALAFQFGWLGAGRRRNRW